MWKRNLFFAALLIAGFGWIGGNLLRRERIETPRDFAPLRLKQPEFADVIDRVNRAFQESWRREGLAPAPPADDLQIARRLTLGLAGTIPSLEEIRELEKTPSADRLEWMVSRLLEDRRYADHIAERLARAYVGVEDGPFLVYRRRRFIAWLADQLHQDEMRYDALVRKLISDKGLWTDRPAVNFVTVTLQQNETQRPDPVRLAARTSRVFLGMRIDCLQCHDDKLDKVTLDAGGALRSGLQSDFHQLAAFFADAESTGLGVVDRSRPYAFKYLGDEQEQVVDEKVPFDDRLLSGGGSRREQLARWITHPENKPFARAAVNRFWALVFGRPLVEPVDDIPLHAELPPALELLADDFARHGFDVRRLIRVVTALDVFRLDSRADFEITERHEKAWAAFPLTRLRPEQFSGGMVQSASLKTIDAHSHIVFQLAKGAQQKEFVERYGDTGEDEFDDRGGTIPQRLLVMNGGEVQERIKADELFNAAARIASFAPDDATAVETAYLATLTRRPTPAERDALVKRLADAPGDDRKRPMEDLYWMLLNSTEFAWNH